MLAELSEYDYNAAVEVIENTIRMLGDTEISSELSAIKDFYSSVQPEFDRFMKEMDLHCPSGCGSCCAHYIPDVTASEALLIGAKVLFGEQKDVLRARVNEPVFPDSTCPFYDIWAEKHHCMIYSVRPLACRMFFSCPSEGKHGELVFSPCRFIPGRNPIPSDSIEKKGFRPMSYYGALLNSLPGNSSSTEPVHAAVEKAVNRLGYALNLLFPDSSTALQDGRIRIGEDVTPQA